jgi:hypothetical protein
MQTIKCGEGGGICGVPEPVSLVPHEVESYGEGATYTQRATEFHASFPLDGTVTIIEREFLDDTEHAHVFWPRDTEWVSAEPRKAYPREVTDICENALRTWWQ